MTDLPATHRLDPVEHTRFLEFVRTIECVDETHGTGAAGNGECVDCIHDHHDYSLEHYGGGTSRDAVAWALKESLIEHEVGWLFRRIKQLSQIRHGDPFYYFHGHHEMEEPQKSSAYPTKKTIGSTQRQRIFERDEYRCQSCGSWKSLSLDHVIPESREGTHDDDNLQTLCKPCNSSKGVKTQDEWEASR